MSKFTGSHVVKLVDDNIVQVGTVSNPLSVSVSGAGSGGTSTVDKAAFVAGTAAGTALMGVVTPTDVGLSADVVALAALDVNRNLKVNIAAGSSGNGASSATGSAVPAQAGYTGIKVGANLQGATGYDLDTGAGVEYALGVGLRKAASGGSVEAGTATDPIRIDPVGSTTQPVSGTVTANIGTIATLATAANQTTTNSSLSSIDGKITACNTGAVVISSGTLAVTESGTWTVQPGNTANTTPWLITDTPATSGGLSKFHLVGAATDNVTNIKNGPGQVYSITAFNVASTPRYLKFHNTSTTPTSGTGVTETFLIPGNTSGAGFVLNIDKGIVFTTGISISIVTGIADNSTAAISASEVVVNIYYK